MNLRRRQRRQRRLLSGIGEGVRRADPHLASMLAIFSRLAADDDMPGHERLPGCPVRARARAVIRSLRCVSPLPPDPAAVPGVSPLPPDPAAIPNGSPLPPDSGPPAGGRGV